LGQPSDIKPTVIFLVFIYRYNKVFDGYHKVVILNNGLKCFLKYEESIIFWRAV
jgi:hypothetical protein